MNVGVFVGVGNFIVIDLAEPIVGGDRTGVARKMFKALSDKGINVQAISTSEIKISVLIAIAHPF